MGLKGKEELDRIQGLTKWVPQPGRITRTIVNENIERSLRRMSVSSLDFNSTGGIITTRITWTHSDIYPISGIKE